MANMIQPAPAHRHESEAATQLRLSAEADELAARAPAHAERHRQHTLRGLADVDTGQLIDDDAMQAWASSLGTDHELPPPEPD
jgi:predicted transcriptional regulator